MTPAAVSIMSLAQAADAAPAEEMSATWIDRLLGLSRLSWFDEGVTLGWRYPLPAWLWTLIVLAVLALAFWSYSRMLGPAVVRCVLAALRAGVLLLIVILLTGPMLVRTDELVEPDWLIMLVDRSASMGLRDVVDDTGGAVSRDQFLRRVMSEHAEMFQPEALGRERRIVWLGFGAETFEIGPPDAVADWPDADDPATHVRTAIEQAIQRAAGRPISGVVLITDGRSPQPTGIDFARRLQQQAVSIFPVPIGSADLPLDLALTEVDAPRRAFVDDIVPIRVTVEQIAGDAPVNPADVTVRLIDTANGETLDERTLAADGLGRPARLTALRAEVGRAAWRIEVDYRRSGGADAVSELVLENNGRALDIEFIDRPVRVLFIEGYPRWEYRYLKNLLMREESIASSMLLVSADRAFAQEGDVPITRPPDDAEELADYDVIIIGDVPTDYLSARQMALIRDHVASRGAGLIWIGGEQHTPVAYDNTALSDLLPMRDPGSVDRYGGDGNYEMRPTPLAHTLSVLQLRGPGDEQNSDPEWPEDLPPMHWVQDMGALKPTAEALAFEPNHSADDGPLPLVVRLRYGAGQSVYVATDETWRWRYGRGELYFEQFWIQLVRMLGRDRVQESTDLARLGVSHKRVGVEETVVVELVVEDPALLRRELPSVAVAVVEAGNEDAGPVDTLELRESTDPSEPIHSTARRTYTATWRPATPGSFVLRVIEPGLDAMELNAEIDVTATHDELRQPEPDHARLIALARSTGGQVVPPAQIEQLRELLPNRARRTPNDVTEPMTNSMFALILVVGLLTVEWVVRKLIRLV